MKRLLIYILSALAFCSCSFLDIDTPGIVDKDKMFEDERGFIDAMNGVYASMASPALYGGDLSFGFVDEIAQLYYNDYESNETTLSKTYALRYKDDDVRATIDAIWADAYNAIACANSILDNAEGHNEAVVRRICGEALVARAMLHFDLLRLFAKGMEAPESEAIPYVEHFSINPVRRSTVRDVYEHMTEDLGKALEIFDEAPVPSRDASALYAGPAAAHALLARVYNWAGNKQEAASEAKAALEGDYAFTRESDVKTMFQGYIAKKECIWGLNAPKMYLTIRSRLMPGRRTETVNMVRQDFQEIFNVGTYTATNNDYRFQAYFQRTGWTNSTVLLQKLYDKYYDDEQVAPEGRVPGINLLRIPELYYIMAEAVWDSDKEAARKYINEVITSLGLNPVKDESITTPEAFRSLLLGEYVKEYWGEGQIFFTYKRFKRDMKNVLGETIPASEEVYVLPLPEAEYAL